MTHKTVPVEPTEILRIARMAEALKQECGSDPESAQAARNMQYMAISYALRALLEAAPPSPVTELEAMLYEALRAFRDGGPEGGTDFNGWHQSYEEPCRLAREALAAYEAKKETK